MKGIFREQKGQSLVEFALLLPLLLLLICGVIDIGRLMYAFVSLNTTAQETVRLGGLGKGDADIISYARNHVRVKSEDELTIAIEPPDSTRDSGDDVSVTLSYSLPLLTPIVSQIIPEPVISASSTIRVE